jgi:hypothetical protein
MWPSSSFWVLTRTEIELRNAVANLRAHHYQGLATLIVYLGAHVPLTCFQYLVAIRLSLTFALRRHSHGGGATCEQCHRPNADRRAAREAHEAVTVHYSTITSGSQVIKYSVTRDRLSSELELLQDRNGRPDEQISISGDTRYLRLC